LVLKPIALGPSQKTPGLTKFSITLPKLRRKIQTTMLQTETTQLVLHMLVSSRKKTKDAEFQNPSSKTEKRDLKLCPGKKSMLLLSQLTGTGETSMERTTFHGTRTNISQSIADHAGLKEPLLLLLIDSTLCLVTCQ